ncbi:MAG TPA: PIN domain-containing protein [Amycolatopsis sp.]|nr:PIN domain-containing protein [Amycolatopsis sp.]
MARLILDTGVLIGAVRGKLDLGSWPASDELAVPAVAVAEYLAGVLQDHDPGRTAAQRDFLERALAVLPVIDYTEEVAAVHAALLAHTRRTGQKRGPHDLMIAASAVASKRELVTTDAHARFDELPDVKSRLVA